MAHYRYRSSKNPAGTTHRALQWLGEEKKIAAITAWVFENLEPQQSDHIIIYEDDVIDLWDILTFEFEDVVTFETIERAIYALPNFNWVTRGHPRVGSTTSAVDTNTRRRPARFGQFVPPNRGRLIRSQQTFDLESIA